jgi:hypothetical protein
MRPEREKVRRRRAGDFFHAEVRLCPMQRILRGGITPAVKISRVIVSDIPHPQFASFFILHQPAAPKVRSDALPFFRAAHHRIGRMFSRGIKLLRQIFCVGYSRLAQQQNAYLADPRGLRARPCEKR